MEGFLSHRSPASDGAVFFLSFHVLSFAKHVQEKNLKFVIDWGETFHFCHISAILVE